jgi:hypothetical protein
MEPDKDRERATNPVQVRRDNTITINRSRLAPQLRHLADDAHRLVREGIEVLGCYAWR